MKDVIKNDITKYLGTLYKEQWTNRESLGMGAYIWLFNGQYCLRTPGYTIGAIEVENGRVKNILVNDIPDSINQFILSPEELSKDLNDRFRGEEI